MAAMAVLDSAAVRSSAASASAAACTSLVILLPAGFQVIEESSRVFALCCDVHSSTLGLGLLLLTALDALALLSRHACTEDDDASGTTTGDALTSAYGGSPSLVSPLANLP